MYKWKIERRFVLFFSFTVCYCYCSFFCVVGGKNGNEQYRWMGNWEIEIKMHEIFVIFIASQRRSSKTSHSFETESVTAQHRIFEHWNSPETGHKCAMSPQQSKTAERTFSLAWFYRFSLLSHILHAIAFYEKEKSYHHRFAKNASWLSCLCDIFIVR